MARSGDFTLNKTAAQILTAAFRRASIYGPSESLKSEDRDTALENLNAMIARWQTTGFFQWKQREMVLALREGIRYYEVGPTGDYCGYSDDFIQTEAAAEALAASNQVTVASTALFTGANNVLNFDPTDATTGWVTTSGTLTAISTGLQLTSGGAASYTEYTLSNVITSSTEYLVKLTLDTLTSTNVTVSVYDVGLTTTLNSSVAVTATGEAALYFTPAQDTIIIRVENDSVGAGQISEFSSLELCDVLTGEFIGLKDITDAREWNRVGRVIDSTTLELASALTNTVAQGNSIFAYKTQVARPMKVDNIRSQIYGQDFELPVNQWSREEYQQQTIKDSSGTVTNAWYEQNLDSGRMYVWQVSNTVDQVLIFNGYIPFQIFVDNIDEPDFPAEWFDCITWNLASQLAVEYLVPAERRQEINAKAGIYYNEAKSWDEDSGSLFISTREYG